MGNLLIWMLIYQILEIALLVIILDYLGPDKHILSHERDLKYQLSCMNKKGFAYLQADLPDIGNGIASDISRLHGPCKSSS